MGRPLQLTKSVQDRITQAIAMGATYKLAAQYGGVSYVSFREWMKLGEADDAPSPFAEFYDAVHRAEGMAAVGWLAKIEQSANDGTWQAAAWKLERRYPQEYGRQALEVTGKDGEALAGPSVVIYMPQKIADEGDSSDL